MRWIVQTSLRFRYLIVFLAVALMVFGIARLSNSSVDVFPEFAPPKVEIQTISSGWPPPPWRNWSPFRWNRRWLGCQGWM